jgi:hypothetical protein
MEGDKNTDWEWAGPRLKHVLVTVREESKKSKGK